MVLFNSSYQQLFSVQNRQLRYSNDERNAPINIDLNWVLIRVSQFNQDRVNKRKNQEFSTQMYQINYLGN